MATILAELCQALIETTLGELCAQLFAVLAEHGRLTVNQLCIQSKLPLRQVRHGLIILIEQQLVQRYASDDNASAFYQVEWKAAYHIARHDNIIGIVGDRYGENAGLIVDNILRIGQARIGDIAQSYHLLIDRPSGETDNTVSQDPGKGDKPNGTFTSCASSSHNSPEIVEFHSIVRTLLHSGVLAKVAPRTYIPYPDLQEEIEETVISEKFPDGKINGTKKRAEFNTAVRQLKRQWQDEDEYSDARDLVSKGAATYPNKRTKVNGASSNGYKNGTGETDTGLRLSADLVVRVNHSRCTLAMRTRRLEQLARRFLGPTTSTVYAALLQVLEDKCDNIEMDETDKTSFPVASIREVVSVLDPKIDLAATIKGHAGDKEPMNGHKIRNNIQIIDGDDDIGDGRVKPEASSDMEDDEHPSNGVMTYREISQRNLLVEAHLGVLAEHPKSFCSRVRKDGGQNEWLVNFPAIVEVLMRTELDEMILARHGRIHLRMVRMLREKGKLDEKQIGALGMMLVKDVYGLLCPLQNDGILEGQELPKDNARQPNRALYLWYIDDQRVRDNLLQRTYKTMARHLQRIPVEQGNFKSIIEKAQRSDIRGREQQKLTEPERQALRKWQETEERLLTQVSRLDEFVALFRDYSGKDISLRG